MLTGQLINLLHGVFLMKKYTQNDKIEQVTEKTLVVGVDIGSVKQYARAFDYRGREIDHVYRFMDCRDGYELFLD